MSQAELERIQRDLDITYRAQGAILGMAVADALGAPYEFGRVRPGVRFTGGLEDMTGGNGWEPGEWTDDTAMAIPILYALDHGLDLLTPQAQDSIVAAWTEWAKDAKDVGTQTRQVLSRLREPTAADSTVAAYEVHVEHGRSGGNGSVMRTAPVGLAYMGDADGPRKVAEVARAIAALTHFEADARDAAALWSVAVHLAVRDGCFQVADALAVLDEPARSRWAGLLAAAEGADPDSFEHNGWVVHAVQAAWAAMVAGGLDVARAETHTEAAFVAVMNAAVDVHNDSDTVAAIAGGLAGALVGARAIPNGWARPLHGWPVVEGQSMQTKGLVRLAMRAVNSRG